MAIAILSYRLGFCLRVDLANKLLLVVDYGVREKLLFLLLLLIRLLLGLMLHV